MRSRAVRAALLLAALALAAAGCGDIFSSLTPFGIGERGPDQDLVAYSGVWTGTTASGGALTFTVSGGEVVDLLFFHLTDTCTQSFSFSQTPLPIDGASFSYDGGFDPQGRLLVEGTFTSSDTASGSYAYQGFATQSGCSTSGGGTFTASRLRRP